MKIMTITGKQQCEPVERLDPNPAGDVVVVKIQVTPMCTEYKAYAGGVVTDTLGHEAAGVVVAVAQPSRVKEGDRVVVMPQYPCGKCVLCLQGEYIHCPNTFDVLKATGNSAGSATYAQYVLKPDWLVVPIPDDISTEHAAMACCGLGPTFGAMEKLKVDRFDTLLITGLGPVGLGGVINGVYRGARVIGVDGNPFRAELALKLGAEVVLNPSDGDIRRHILELTQGRGVDKAVECSGTVSAQRLMIDSARTRGAIAFVGEAGELTFHISNDLLRKGLTVYGQWHYNLASTPKIMAMIREVTGQLDIHITHRFPMSRVQEAFDLQLGGRCGKVLLNPWE